VLAEHGIKIAPSTYYEAIARRPSKRVLRDAELVALIEAERARQKLLARFGARKMWLHLRGKGHDVARCTVERLYREQGWVGALRLKKVRTTIGDPAAERPLDRVDRQFWASRPNQLWVADFTYVATWAGTVYVAFIFDVFSRRIVGWRAATRMTTELVLDTLEHAIWTRRQAGITDLSGLIHHTDAGSQGGFNWSSQHPEFGGVRRWRPRIGARRPAMRPRNCAGSGVRIGRCGRRCVRPGGLIPRGWCSGSSGV
jgi:putative transposase